MNRKKCKISFRVCPSMKLTIDSHNKKVLQKQQPTPPHPPATVWKTAPSRKGDVEPKPSYTARKFKTQNTLDQGLYSFATASQAEIFQNGLLSWDFLPLKLRFQISLLTKEKLISFVEKHHSVLPVTKSQNRGIFSRSQKKDYVVYPP